MYAGKEPQRLDYIRLTSFMFQDTLYCSLAYCLQSVQEASHYCMSAFRGGDEHLPNKRMTENGRVLHLFGQTFFLEILFVATKSCLA